MAQNGLCLRSWRRWGLQPHGDLNTRRFCLTVSGCFLSSKWCYSLHVWCVVSCVMRVYVWPQRIVCAAAIPAMALECIGGRQAVNHLRDSFGATTMLAVVLKTCFAHPDTKVHVSVSFSFCFPVFLSFSFSLVRFYSSLHYLISEFLDRLALRTRNSSTLFVGKAR